MSNNTLPKIEKLLQGVQASKASRFYKEHWARNYEFNKLPLVTIENLIKTPLQERTYKKERGLTKIVKRTGEPFLIHRALGDIKAEDYGVIGKRPLIIFSDSHDALEKSLWCYENNILPLIGENLNLVVTAYTARRYEIDSILGEGEIVMRFLPILEKEYDLKNIKNITLIEGPLDDNQAKLICKKIPNTNLTLGFSETGAFAQLCGSCSDSKKLLFSSDRNSFVEIEEGVLVVTKTLDLTTPIVRYDTGIRVIQISSKDISCDKGAHFSLL